LTGGGNLRGVRSRSERGEVEIYFWERERSRSERGEVEIYFWERERSRSEREEHLALVHEGSWGSDLEGRCWR
jgi:hypothetical protein